MRTAVLCASVLFAFHAVAAEPTFPVRPVRMIVSNTPGSAPDVRTPEIQERLDAVGAEAVGSTASEFGAFLLKETGRWEKVLREGGTLPANKG